MSGATLEALITSQEYRAFPLTEVSAPHLEIFLEGGYNIHGNSPLYAGRLAPDCRGP